MIVTNDQITIILFINECCLVTLLSMGNKYGTKVHESLRHEPANHQSKTSVCLLKLKSGTLGTSIWKFILRFRPLALNLIFQIEIGAAWVWIWKFKLKLWLLEFESEFSNWNLGCLSLNLKVQIETLEFEFEFSNWNLGRWDLSLKFQNEVLQSVFVDSSPIIKFLPIRWIMFHAYHIYESCFDTTRCKSILLF